MSSSRAEVKAMVVGVGERACGGRAEVKRGCQAWSFEAYRAVQLPFYFHDV
jgi:hypothetical protein